MGEPTALPWKWHSRIEGDLQTGSIYSEVHRGGAYAVAIAPRYQKTDQWETDAAFIVLACNNHDRLTRENEAMRKAMTEACDFLAERAYGSPARSPGHNARVRLESALASLKESPDAQA